MLEADGLFIKRVANGENVHKVYKEVYGADVSRATKLIADPEINKSLTERLRDDGITERKLNKKLVDKLNSKKVIYYDPKLSKDVVDDNDAQLKAVQTGYKILGLLKENNTFIDARQVTFNGDLAKLSAVVAEMKELNKSLITDTDGEVL